MSAIREGERLDAYRALLEETKREILAAVPKQDPRSWRLVSVVLPIVLTSLFSLFVYRIQSSMADKVDRDSKALQARLSLTQDYYRERLRIYQIIHATVSQVREKAQTIRGASVDEAGLDNSVSALYRSYANNSIFLTRDLEQRLRDLWAHSLTVLRGDRVSKADAEKIVEGITGIEEQMRRDLLIDELTAEQKLLQQPAETPPK
ncbi:MAG TPA: hypothetical protein VKS23_09000 [Thermoanaerobaculia bacterium]|nr:hypothetical protein [Thermoanaerobaculia bacterium]